MSQKDILSFFLLTVCYLTTAAQNYNPFNKQDTVYFSENPPVRIIFYNTENLFDTFRDSLKNDGDYTPQTVRRWNFNKYYRKLNNIARVILAAGKWEPPALIGLCEVENKIVLSELTRKTPLEKFKYDFIHYDSPDERGIDAAILYRPEIIKINHSKPIPLKFPTDTAVKTRDILYVKGLLHYTDTVHLFVNHFPSRREGKEETEHKRIYCARVLKDLTDSILLINKYANIIIMGDFNDEPFDKSLYEILQAKCNTDGNTKLVNLMCEIKAEGHFTYFYKYLFIAQKNVLDQFIVSANLLDTNSKLQINKGKAYIFNPEWLLKKDNKGNIMPFSTYRGPRYNGGYSDHLPVYIDLKSALPD